MKSFKCEKCDIIVEVSKLPKTKLCKTCKENRTFIKKCRDCGTDLILPLGSKVLLCGKCKITACKNHFNIKEIQVYCRRCGKHLGSKIKKGSKGKDEGVLCDDCRYRKDIFIRYSICKYCLKTITYTETNICYQTKNIHTYKICHECQDLSKNNKNAIHNKESIKDNFIIQAKTLNKIKFIICRHCLNIYSYKEDWSLSKKHFYRTCDECKQIQHNNISIRMKVNNPMFNSDTKTKVRNTLLNRFKSGKIKILKGKDRYNFNGDKSIYTACRFAIAPWIKERLAYDDYTCRRCGIRGGKLHVHHLQSFKSIVDNVLYQFNCSPHIKYTDFLYDVIVEEVVNKHIIDFGVSVCPKCHETIDYRYRSTKNESKDYLSCKEEEYRLQLSLWAA